MMGLSAGLAVSIGTWYCTLPTTCDIITNNTGIRPLITFTMHTNTTSRTAFISQLSRWSDKFYHIVANHKVIILKSRLYTLSKYQYYTAETDISIKMTDKQYVNNIFHDYINK